MKYIFEPLPIDPSRGYIRLANDGARLYIAFIEKIKANAIQNEHWCIREFSWFTEINSKWLMPTHKAMTPSELIELAEFIKTIPLS